MEPISENPILSLPSPACKESFLAAEFASRENEGRSFFHAWQVDEGSFDSMLKHLEANRHGNNLQPGEPPCTTYWLTEGDRFIGQVKIRHHLTPELSEVGGHISFAIAATERNKGHGSLILKLALPHAKELGIDPALITCKPTNAASRKIIEANGGKLDSSQEGQQLKYVVPTS